MNDKVLIEQENVILQRKSENEENSYTCYLFKSGLDKILKKVGEECTETVIAAKNLGAGAGDVTELKKQLDVNLFGLLRVIKFFANNLAKNAKIINISSMASYGLFPFISPYCLSKAASDILLRSFSLESNVRYVSVRPGAVKTKFWTESIRNNENNFLNFAEKYSKEGDFILKNAYKNSQNASNPLIVAKAVCSAVCDKNPPPVINVGSDACLCSWASRLFSASLLDNVIRLAMRLKVK